MERIRPAVPSCTMYGFTVVGLVFLTALSFRGRRRRFPVVALAVIAVVVFVTAAAVDAVRCCCFCCFSFLLSYSVWLLLN